MATLTINTYHGSLNKSRRTGGLGAIANFATHYTGGVGSAKNNCIYFATANRKASADFFIDKDGSIWEYNNILDGYNTWHVGDGKGAYGITNTNSIGVEVVSNGEDFTVAQRASLSKLYAHCCSVLGRKLDVVRHYDASRKYCPSPYVDASKWRALKAEILEGPPTQAADRPAASERPAAPTTASAKTTVADFQKWLNKTYGYSLAIDCKFGPDSKKHAVMALQTEYNRQFGERLSVDGKPGPATKAAWSRHNIRRGAKGNITRIIQGLLIAKGLDPKGCDSSFGPGCEAAVEEYQRRNGLKDDGVVGSGTFSKLVS